MEFIISMSLVFGTRRQSPAAPSQAWPATATTHVRFGRAHHIATLLHLCILAL